MYSTDCTLLYTKVDSIQYFTVLYCSVYCNVQIVLYCTKCNVLYTLYCTDCTVSYSISFSWALPSGTPSGEVVYLTVYPSSCPNTYTLYHS